MSRTCEYSLCNVAFEPRRPHQRFHSESCRYAQWADEQQNGSEDGAQRVGAHALDEVRGVAEESAEKSRWTLIAREHLTHTLIETGYFSADDFESIGIPAEHVNVGNSQMGRFSKQKLMEAITWRYSTKPSRKGGKLWTYRITAKGRQDLPKLLTDTRKELASAGLGIENPEGISPHARVKGTLDRLGGRNAFPADGAGSSLDAEPGNPLPGGDATPLPAPPGAVPDVEGEALTLLPEVPSTFDPDMRAA